MAVVLAVTPARASLDCHGVLEYDDGVVKGRFRCKSDDEGVRRVRAVCHDGEAGCDADAACDGACRFALCADAACDDTVEVVVPLRRGGKAKGRATFRSGHTRVHLKCLPPRGACGSTVSTTTTTTTSTTLPGQACSATLTGAAEGSVNCSASLGSIVLGLLPVLKLELDSNGFAGTATVLLAGSAPATYTIGHGAILAVLGLRAPEERTFQATADGGPIEVRIDTVTPTPGPGDIVHGSIDATLRDVFSTATVRLQATF